jgi:hypothetical protein
LKLASGQRPRATTGAAPGAKTEGGGIVPPSPLRDGHQGDTFGQQTLSGGFSPIPLVVNQSARAYTPAMTVWAIVEAILADRKLGEDPDVRRRLEESLGCLVNTLRDKYGYLPNPIVNPFPPSNLGLPCQCVFIFTRIEHLNKAGAFPSIFARSPRRPRRRGPSRPVALTRALREGCVRVRPR